MNRKIYTCFIFLVGMLIFKNANTQDCKLFLEEVIHPSSCYVEDGHLNIFAQDDDNSCERTIWVYDQSNQLIAEGTYNLILDNLGSGLYSIIADSDCGCPVQTKGIILNGGEPTNLIPIVDKGNGFYQANSVFVCSGSDLKMGVESVGINNVNISGSNGFYSDIPDAATYWEFNNITEDQEALYTIEYTNSDNCISTVTIDLRVSKLDVDAGPEQSACVGEEHDLTANVSGESVCPSSCEESETELLVNWTLDQCNAQDQNNQNDYSEFVPDIVSFGSCVNVSASNVYRDQGEHSCTFVGADNIGMCLPSEASCDPNDYDETLALKFEITVDPSEVGSISELSFYEQSPLIWTTTNGSSGVNNYNTKYQIRVYKNNLLIFSQDNIDTELNWNEESFDFSGNEEFTITESSTFRFELRGYCVVDNGGNMSGWEIDDIKIFGGCCSMNENSGDVSYEWSTGETTPVISVNPDETTTYYVTVTDCSGCEAVDSTVVTKFALPTAMISGDNELCLGESSELTASGGLSYEWSTGETTSVIEVSPMQTTTYSVTVLDANGCEDATSYEVVVHGLPMAMISGDNELCLGESSELTASGGLSYEWSTGETTSVIEVSPMQTTTYSVTVVDVNGCEGETSYEVVVHGLPTATISGDNELCLGESSELTASGGLSYEWSTGETTSVIEVSPMQTTTYSVTVVDVNGCEGETSYEVVVHGLPTAMISGDNELCLGESSELTASGGLSYEWSTGETTSVIEVSPMQTTTYSVTVLDANGCEDATSYEVVVHDLPTAMISGDNELCLGESSELTASGGLSYEWSTGETTTVIEVSPMQTTTYSVTVLDANGCEDATSYEVVVHDLPTATISGDNELCLGESSELTASGGLSYEWSTGETTSVIEVSPMQTTTYSVTVVDVNGCEDATSYEVVVHGLPTATISGDNELCLGESSELTASGGLSYEWSTGETTSVIEVSPMQTTTYSVTVLDVNGCEDATSYEVVVHGLPTATISGDNELCLGESSELTASGGLSYEWSTGETTSVIEVSPMQTTTYSVTVLDVNGCEDATSYEVVVHGLPTAMISGDNELCLGESSELTASGGLSYEWSTGETTSVIEVSPMQTTTYSVTVLDVNGCEGETSYEVVVHGLPTAMISGDNELCLGESSELTASGGLSYEWSTGETTSVIEVSPMQTTTYSVTVLDANGCEGETSYEVVVHGLPTAMISGDNELCLGESSELTASGGLSYEWSTGETTSVIEVSPMQTTTYSVTVLDANGCEGETSYEVVVHGLPTAMISGDNELCLGESSELTASGGLSYEWSTGETTSVIEVSPMQTTTYSVTVLDANGCEGETSYEVVVHGLPTATISGDNELCLGESSELTASGGLSYEWSTGETTSVIEVSPMQTTTYSVTVLDVNGCEGETSYEVVVHGLPTATISGDNELCLGESSELTASGGLSYEWSTGETTSVIEVSPMQTTTYSVTVLDANGCEDATSYEVVVHGLPTAMISGDNELCLGESSELTASGGLSYEWSTGETTSVIEVSPMQTTTYSVTVLDANGCEDATSYEVVVHGLPTAMISGDNELCLGESSELTASGGLSYEWSTGETTSVIEVSPMQTTTYSVTVLDANGCEGETSYEVVVHGLPTAMISGDNELCLGESSELTASGGLSYEWSTGETTSVIEVSPMQTTTYSVTVLDVNGCEGETSYEVVVHDNPDITIEGDLEICEGECTELMASGGVSYEWDATGESNCDGTYYVGGSQFSDRQSLYVYGEQGLEERGELTVENINGIGYYCSEGGEDLLYGMHRPGDSPLEAIRGYLTEIDTDSGESMILGEIPQPPNLYGATGVTGIFNYIGDISEGIYYFPAMTGLIDPITFDVIDYTIYIGKIDLSDHGNGSNVEYEILNVFNSCNTYLDACVVGFQSYALDPSNEEPSGGIQDWVIEGDKIYGFLGIENGLLEIDLNTNTASCISGPVENAIYTGETGAQTDEFGGMYIEGGDLYGWQVDRGRLFRIDRSTGLLTLVDGGLPLDYRGDTAGCKPCGSENVLIVCPEETTTYTVTVTDSNGCTASESVTVVVYESPTAMISGDNELCLGESSELTASGGLSYEWSTGETTSVIEVSPMQTTTYSVTVLDVNGCEGETSYEVVVHGLPTAMISGDNELCLGESSELTASGGLSYEWSTGETTSVIEVSPMQTTTYSVTVLDANGCEGETSYEVVVHGLPTATISGDNELCLGESSELTASGGLSYEWSTGETTSVIEVSPMQTTTYSVTVLDVNGCEGETSYEVVVHGLPTAMISGDNELCLGESSELTASGGLSYEWSTGETTSVIEVSPMQTTTYSVTVLDANGCEGETSYEVVVHGLPTAMISGDNELCLGESSELTASGGLSYEWSTGETTSVIGVSPMQTTTYSVTVLDVNGCEGETSYEVVVHDNPDITIEGDLEICEGECTELMASGGVSYEWDATGESNCDGTYYVGGSQFSDRQSLYVYGEQGLEERGELTVENINGIGYYCSEGGEDLLYGMHRPGDSPLEAIRGYLTEIDTDSGESMILGEIPQPPNLYGATGVTGIFNYIGDISEGIYYFPAMTGLIDPITFDVIDYTIYIGKIDLSDHGNGSNVEYEILNVFNSCNTYLDACVVGFQSYALDPSNEEPSGGIQDWVIEGDKIYGFLGIENGLLEIDLNTNTASCISGPVENAIYTGETGAQTDEFGGMYIEGGDLYGWQVDRGRLFRIDRSTGLLTLVDGGLPLDYRGDTAGCKPCGSENVLIVCPEETTTYTVTVTDSNGCTASESVTVVVYESPTAMISGDNELCLGESSELTASGGLSYEWSTGETTSVIEVSPMQTTTYSVTVLDVNGCEGETSYEVVVHGLPTAMISGDNELCLGESSELTASGGLSYEWSTGETTSVIEVSPMQTTTYSVTVLDANGCEGETSYEVVVHGLPTATISGDNELCLGESSELTASGGLSYEWSTGETTSVIEVSPMQTTTYSVTVLDANGCEDATSYEVVVHGLPTAMISGDNELCLGESSELTASGGLSYEWSTGETTSVIEVSPMQTTTYSVTVLDVNGCEGETSYEVVVHGLPTAMIQGPDIVCEGHEIELTASGGASYEWSTGEITATILVIPNENTQIFTVTVTDVNGCSDTATHEVESKPKPTLYVNGDGMICKGDIATIVATGSTISDCSNTCDVDNEIVFAFWDLEDCASNKFDGTNLSFDEFIGETEVGSCVNVSITNVYREEGAHSCSPRDNEVSMCIGTQDVCQAKNIDYDKALKFEVEVTPNTIGRITKLEFYERSPEYYDWIGGANGTNNYVLKYALRVWKDDHIIYYDDNMTSSTEWNKVIVDFSNNANFETLGVGNYMFEIAPYCRVQNGANISVWDIDNIKVYGNCCEGSQTEITQYMWSNGETGSSIMVSPDETTNYTVTVTDCCGCTSTEEFEVMVNCLMVDLGDNEVINQGESVTLTPMLTNESPCEQVCIPENSLIGWYNLEECQAGDIPNQYSYAEFFADYPNDSECTQFALSEIQRDGLHSCTSGVNDFGTAMCIEPSDACSSELIDESEAIRFNVTIDPNEKGHISKLTFYEKSPLFWETNSGNGGINNYNTLYAVKVYRGNELVYDSIDVPTSHDWTLQEHNFENIEAFKVSEETRFYFEIYAYCIEDIGGSVSVWDIDNISIFGGCCREESVIRTEYQWSNGATTPTITVSPDDTEVYSVTVTDCKLCTATDEITVEVIDNGGALILYPNPAIERVEIKYFSEFASTPIVRMYNEDGRYIGDLEYTMVSTNKLSAELPKGLLSGIYYLEVETGGIRYRDQLIKINR